MRTFTDNKGRTWDVEINVTTLRWARDLAGVNLTRILDDGFLETFLDDAFQKADALYAICRDQAERRNVTDHDFGLGLTGEPMAEAEIALLGELADFFPTRRALLEKITARHRRMRDLADAKILAWIDDPANETRLLDRITKNLEA